MAFSNLVRPMRRVRTETLWYILSAVFFTIGVIGGLGEWVFHWWRDPWEWASPLSLGLAGFTLIWGASAHDVRRAGDGLRDLHHELASGQGRLAQGQERLVDSQERLVDGQERLVHGQERLVHGQERLVEGQNRLVEGQERIASGQDRIIAGQAEQTSLLREVVSSFRHR